MDSRGRLDTYERACIAAAVSRYAVDRIPIEDLRQEAHIALWSKPHDKALAYHVARSAMVQAIRDELGRTDGSPRRSEPVPYDEAKHRSSAHGPEAALRAKQALRVIEQATPQMRRYVEAVIEHGSMAEAARHLGTSIAAVYQPLMRLRSRLAAAIDVSSCRRIREGENSLRNDSAQILSN